MEFNCPDRADADKQHQVCSQAFARASAFLPPTQSKNKSPINGHAKAGPTAFPNGHPKDIGRRPTAEVQPAVVPRRFHVIASTLIQQGISELFVAIVAV